MGFGGGGSGGPLTNHVHNNVPLQGGPLDFANDTIASLNAGSTTFSDGAALQELVIGNVGESMVVNGAGTAPEWGSAAGGGSFVFLESFTAAAASTFTCTLASPIALADFTQLVCIFNGLYGAGACELQIANNLDSPVTTNTYDSWYTVAGAASVNNAGTDCFNIGATGTGAAGSKGQIVFNLTVNPTQGAGAGRPSDMLVYWVQNGSYTYSNGGGYTYSTVGNITTIDGFHLTNSLGNNFDASSTLDVYKVVG